MKGAQQDGPNELALRAAASVAVIAGVLFLAWFGLVRIRETERLTRPLPAIEIPPTVYDRLEAFYARCTPTCVNLDTVAETVAHAQDATALLCIEDQTETFLAIIHRESHFNPRTDDGDSRGVAQVRRRYERRLRKAWSRLGVELGPIKEIKTQVYMGAMIFRDKLRNADGYVLGGVLRYNGTGDAAELYAYRVLASRGRMFPDNPWRPSERAAHLQECP